MKRRKLAALCGAAAMGIALLGVARAADAAQVSGGSTPVAAGCIERGAAGHQVWHGSAGNPAASALGDRLEAIADAHPDVVSGVAACSDYSGGAIFVSSPSAALLEQITAAGAKYPTARLHVQTVANGLVAQLAATTRVTSLTDSGSFLASVGPDIYSGGLSVTVQAQAWPLAQDVKRRVVAAATSDGKVSMPVRFAMGSVVKNATTRLADTQPFYGGDELIGSSDVCSAGIPLVVSGARRMLTAGHCLDTSFTNNGNPFGTQYTTAYAGNADIYGDWKLLSGQSYGTRIFSGAVSSSSTLLVTSANWGARRAGLQMCTSGRTTGSVCRYFISDSYQSTWDGTAWSNNQLLMYHDSTGTGLNSDASGLKAGDSGGPCYYSDGAGGVIVGGIMKGFSSGTSPTYSCTQLSGVRAWNSAAYFG